MSVGDSDVMPHGVLLKPEAQTQEAYLLIHGDIIHHKHESSATRACRIACVVCGATPCAIMEVLHQCPLLRILQSELSGVLYDEVLA